MRLHLSCGGVNANIFTLHRLYVVSLHISIEVTQEERVEWLWKKLN